MHAKIGAKVLVCMLYGQTLFGLLAVAAVVMKDPPSPRESAQASTFVVASIDKAAMQ